MADVCRAPGCSTILSRYREHGETVCAPCQLAGHSETMERRGPGRPPNPRARGAVAYRLRSAGLAWVEIAGELGVVGRDVSSAISHAAKRWAQSNDRPWPPEAAS